MAVSYATAAKTARLNAVRTDVVNGTLEIGTAGMAAVLATFTLSGTAGSVTNDVWTLAFVAGTVNASAAGTAAAARIRTSGAADRVTGLTVGTSGADINLNNTSIASGQSVTLTSGTITHAA